MNKRELKKIRQAAAAHAREVRAQKRALQVVDIPLEAIPVPPRKPAAGRVARGTRRPNGTEVDALAQLIVAVFAELKRRGE